LLASASLTLIPSLSETFGLVALESAASGTPVIAYRAAGLIESVADGESGVLLDSRDPADWARTMAEFFDDHDSLTAMQTSARRHAEGFTWATSVASLIGVYEGLVAS
jgi:D-inositol-3-phosphate glycosyltransferase